jgi:DNA-binding response OmpR family regulator
MREVDRDVPDDVDADGATAALREVRERFIATFAARCDAIIHLTESVAELGPDGPVDALRQIVHRLAGLAGMVGFADVSREAATLEALVLDVPTQGFARDTAAGAVTRLRGAFEQALTQPAPVWDVPTRATRPASKILLVEDDHDQARLVLDWLRQAGYETSHVASGAAALPAIAAERPALVLLDVELPEMDGYAICRRLKADPELTKIPVIFLTTRASVDDRLRGLALGADDYVAKPADQRELLMRIRLRMTRPDATVQSSARQNTSKQILDFEAFAMIARAELERTSAALALVRVPSPAAPLITRALIDETRRRDLIGRFDRTHLVLLFPEMPAAAARDRLREILQRVVTQGATGIHAGVVATTVAAGATLDVLLAEADDVLASSRYHGTLASTSGERAGTAGPAVSAGTAVLADDDPDVAQIVDAAMRAAGFKTVLAFDGQRAVDAVQAEHPDVLLLDLMMPKLSGFDVLQFLREHDTLPRVVVLSARGREDDVTRAFDLGADDYVTKPFSPQELLVRVTRLLR